MFLSFRVIILILHLYTKNILFHTKYKNISFLTFILIKIYCIN